jgi:REP element-mobilizing transposase RayT
MRSNRINVLVHFVWTTWDKLPILQDDIRRAVYRYIWSTVEAYGCKPVAIGGTDDHVHLLVEMSASVSMSVLVKKVKGASSRIVSKELRSGEWFAWQGGYGAFSVSARDRIIVVRYIENQEEHHKYGGLIELYEPEANNTNTEHLPQDPAD